MFDVFDTLSKVYALHVHIFYKSIVFSYSDIEVIRFTRCNVHFLAVTLIFLQCNCIFLMQIAASIALINGQMSEL